MSKTPEELFKEKKLKEDRFYQKEIEKRKETPGYNFYYAILQKNFSEIYLERMKYYEKYKIDITYMEMMEVCLESDLHQGTYDHAVEDLNNMLNDTNLSKRTKEFIKKANVRTMSSKNIVKLIDIINNELEQKQAQPQ